MKVKTTLPPDPLPFNQWMEYIFKLIHNLNK